MRAWIFSDLYSASERCHATLAVPDADLCICAGDMCGGGPANTVRYLGEQVSREMPVILVPGNREYYSASMVEGLREAMHVAARFYPSVHVLSRRSVVLGGYRFVGATLWSDFNLHGNMYWAMRCAQTELDDYREIKFSNAPPAAVQLWSFKRAEPYRQAFYKDHTRQFVRRPDGGDNASCAKHNVAWSKLRWRCATGERGLES